MMIAAVTLRLYAPWARSLKDKRAVVKSLVAKLQSRFHASAAEIDAQDSHRVLVIGVAAIVANRAMADHWMDEICRFVEENCEAELLEQTRELYG